MILATPRPKSVQLLYQEFQEKTLRSKNYLAIHWRYDRQDFVKHCKRSKTPGNEKPCDEILSGGFNATLLAVNLGEWLYHKGLEKIIKKVYFAAPPIEGDFIEKLGEELKQRFGITTFYGKHIVMFARRKFFDSCGKERYEKQIHDYVSQLEQEVCLWSSIFLNSQASTWSSSIVQERLVRKLGEHDTLNNIFFK